MFNKYLKPALIGAFFCCMLSVSCTKEGAYFPLDPGDKYIYSATVIKDGKKQRLPGIIPQARGSIIVGRAPVSMQFDAIYNVSFAERRTTIKIALDETEVTWEDQDNRRVTMNLPFVVGDSFEVSGSNMSFEVLREFDHETEDWGTKKTVELELQQNNRPLVGLYFTPGIGFTKVDFRSAFYGVKDIEFDLVKIEK